MNSFFRKIARTATCPFFRIIYTNFWKALRYYPPIVPDQQLLERWQQSEWPVYQKWINKNSIKTVAQWHKSHQRALKSTGRVKISIVTPVYNTDSDILKECILSVRTQTSPFWEFILVDDSSTKPETHEVLCSKLCSDPRMQVIFSSNDTGNGISATTNRGIDAANGDFIVFLDHDDRLAPEALKHLIECLEAQPELDIIYSDRDMISPGDKRFMHLMKPQWSPDNLYGGNYIFHLMCYRTSLVKKVGKLRPEFDGSQDYDLILRCMEHDPKIKHLPKVLYHWRQHETSVAMDDDAKNYAFDAGIEALRAALKRRGVKAEVRENKSLWRGNYQIFPELPKAEHIDRIYLPKGLQADKFTAHVLSSPVILNDSPYIYIGAEECIPDDSSLQILAAWLNFARVGIASGCIIDDSDKLIFSGMTFNAHGTPFSPYEGYSSEEPGYMAVTKTTRNISAPAPFSVMIKKELWQHLNGLDPSFTSGYSLVDFALRAQKNNWRTIYIPLAKFRYPATAPGFLSENDQKHFITKWKDWLRNGDPYYNCNFKKNSPNYELA